MKCVALTVLELLTFDAQISDWRVAAWTQTHRQTLSDENITPLFTSFTWRR